MTCRPRRTRNPAARRHPQKPSRIGDAANRIVRTLWSYCDVLRDDGLSYQDYLEQLTLALFLKIADERARLTGAPHSIPAGYRWEDLVGPQMEGAELEIELAARTIRRSVLRCAFQGLLPPHRHPRRRTLPHLFRVGRESADARDHQSIDDFLPFHQEPRLVSRRATVDQPVRQQKRTARNACRIRQYKCCHP